MISARPDHVSTVFWRFKNQAPCAWRFGYCTYTDDPNLVRMGHWNGDRDGGSVVSVSEIEWRPHHA